MKNILKTSMLSTAIVLASTTLSTAHAEGEGAASGGNLSGNIGFMSEYVSRGIPLSNGKVSMKGGLHYNVGNGVYAGFTAITEGNVNPYGEVDAYLGYNYKISNDLQFDAKILTYQFPYADKGFSKHFEELSALLRYDIYEVGVDRFMNREVEGDLYYHVGIEKPLKNNFSVGATIGYNDYASQNDPLNIYDFTHYKVNARWKDFTLAVEHNNNDLFDLDKKVTLDWTKHFGF